MTIGRRTWRVWCPAVMLFLAACEPTGSGGVGPATTRSPDPSPPSTTTTSAPAPAPTADPADPVTPDDFSCTEVIGFSQTRQWYEAGFEEAVGNPEAWRLRALGGASVDRWAAPDFRGWSEVVGGCAEEEPDRVVFTITGAGRPPEGWAEAVLRVVDNIRNRYRGVEQIVLQPVVGGPNDESCPASGGRPVRASANHPTIDRAIAQVVGGDVVAGASPVVSDCSHFADQLGHLSAEGSREVAEALADYYRSP